MGKFVLVHGGCHGAWCYSRVAELLRGEGHSVYTPTLSGVGELAHLAAQSINLSTHVQDVVSLFESLDLDDVVLCGHSYGGLVITGAAGRIGERIRSLFYLDAMLADDGQSLFDTLGPEETFTLLQLAGETGTTVQPPPAEFFQVNPADREWVDAHCTPHPIGSFIQKLRYTGREDLVRHRTYVLARGNPGNLRFYDKVKGQPGWKTVVVDCGHDVMVDEPVQLSRLLLEELKRD